MSQSLQIGLSFLAGFVGALIGALINLWIHYSSLKNIKFENQKNRSVQSTIEVVRLLKDKNISPAELVKIVNEAKPIAELLIKDLNLNQVKDAVSNNNKKLDDDIIRENGEYDYAK